MVARRIEFPITVTPQKGDVRVYTFLVAGNMSELQTEVANFNTLLFWAFAIFGLGLIAAIFLQVRIGLLPRHLGRGNAGFICRIVRSRLAHERRPLTEAGPARDSPRARPHAANARRLWERLRLATESERR